MKKIKSIIVTASMLFTFGAANAMAEEHSAVSSQIEQVQQEKNLVKELVTEFNAHADELIVTPEEPYKEVKLSNGYTIFAEITPGNSASDISSRANEAPSARAQQSKEIKSTHGFKNLYGQIVVQLVTTTKWTYDFDKVLNGTTTTVGEPKMLGWGLKWKDVSDPFKSVYDKEWEWTASAMFSYNVSGVEFDTLELITHHRVKYNGEYAWKYEFVD